MPRMMPLPRNAPRMPSRLEITAFPYQPDPLSYFATLRQQPGAVLLDSGHPHGPGGRYDILSAHPRQVLEVLTDGEIIDSDGRRWPGDAIAAQQILLAELEGNVPDSDLPFLGGLIGFWSYDFGRCLEPQTGADAHATTT